MKRYISIFVIISILFISCSNSEEAPTSVIERVNPEIAFKVSSDYLVYLKNKDFQGIKNISSEDLNASTSYSDKGDMNIVSFSKSDYGEVGSRVYVKYGVNSIREDEPTASLDEYIIYVRQIGDKGIVEEVTSKQNSRVFVKYNNLRIVNDDDAYSKLLFRWSDLPRDVYPRSNKANISRKQVVFKRFGTLGFNYNGNYLGLSAQCEDGDYIGVITMDETITTANENVDGNTPKNNIDSLEEMIGEKPMARKIKTLDFLENSTVEKIVFSRDENSIAIQYDSNGIKRLNVYESDSGKLMDYKIDDTFPREQYSIELYDTVEDGFLADVSAIDNTNAKQRIIGRYFLNLKDSKLYKI